MKQYILISIIILSIFLLSSCAERITTTTTGETIEKINLKLVVAGIENGECVVPEINLWANPELTKMKSSKIYNACQPQEVTAFERVVTRSRTLYHVETKDHATGWITDSFVQTIK